MYNLVLFRRIVWDRIQSSTSVVISSFESSTSETVCWASKKAGYLMFLLSTIDFRGLITSETQLTFRMSSEIIEELKCYIALLLTPTNSLMWTKTIVSLCLLEWVIRINFKFVTFVRRCAIHRINFYPCNPLLNSFQNFLDIRVCCYMPLYWQRAWDVSYSFQNGLEQYSSKSINLSSSSMQPYCTVRMCRVPQWTFN